MSKRKDSTIAALLEDKPKRGRPRSRVQRQNVYVSLSPQQKLRIQSLIPHLPEGLGRADIPDLAITLLSLRLEVLRQAVADRNREIPEGITDIDSLYLLWDLPVPSDDGERRWTSIRLSPQRVIELGRVRGILNALFGVNRSQVFDLSIALFEQFVEREMDGTRSTSVEEAISWMTGIYL